MKQEAIAQDFDVDQSTVSRWERGEREPSLQAKHTILNALFDTGFAQPDQSMQFMLEQSGSAVAVWDRHAKLRGFSRRFEEELLHASQKEVVHNRPAKEILAGSDIVDRTVAILGDHGFFDGAVSVAVFTFPPFLQPRRRAAGGMITSSIFPVLMGDGDIGMLTIMDHDTVAGQDKSSTLTITWLSSRDGHTHTVERPASPAAIE